MVADNGNRLWAWQNWTPGTFPATTPAGPVMGWTCPACGSSYSPSALKCWVCPQQPAATSGTSAPMPEPPSSTCDAMVPVRGRLTIAPVTPGDIAYLLLPPGAGFPPSAFSRLESALAWVSTGNGNLGWLIAGAGLVATLAAWLLAASG